MAKLSKKRIQWKTLANSEGFRKVRKIVVLVVGSIVVLAGVAMLVLPGPALVVIPAGFALLATEFEWARRWSRATLKFIRQATKKENIKRFVRANSLSLTLLLCFLLFLGGQILTGQHSCNSERELAGQPRLKLLHYVLSGHCIEATFENWESEFLQMGVFVLLTAFLRQKGAADSKEVDGRTRRHESTAHADSPWPVKRGGWARKLYEHSLSLTLLGLFLLSFCLHAFGGAQEFNEELARHGQSPVSLSGYLTTSQFWFESFQNWQSEFLSVAVLLVLSIFLREKGSPESKPVNAPHLEAR